MTLARTGILCIAILVALGQVGYAADNTWEKVWNFDRDAVNQPLPGWKAAVNILPPSPPIPAGEPVPEVKATLGKWIAIEMEDAPSGKQVYALPKIDNPTRTFNLTINENEKYKDLEIEVKVKALTGTIDQGGGPIWRVQDQDNYYITRWNPLENNLRLYYVKEGRRKQFQSVDIETDPQAWHTIHVKMVGKKIVVSFDGKALIEAEDSTFESGGGIGLWTKADAATAFDDLKVKPFSQ